MDPRILGGFIYIWCDISVAIYSAGIMPDCMLYGIVVWGDASWWASEETIVIGDAMNKLKLFTH